MALDLVKDANIETSEEWSAVLPVEETTIPEFDIPEKVEKTDEELETERLAAEAAAGKTPEQLEEERIAAEAAAEVNKGLTADEIAANKVKEDAKKSADAIRAEMLKELGFTSLDEIKALKNPAKPETEEEKGKRLERHEADFHQFAVGNDKLSLNEINSFKQLSALPPHDLVYADFANEYKQEFKDRKNGDEPDPVTDDEIKEAFDSIYNTDSANTALKKAGERALKARADEILKPTADKYTAAKQEFDYLSEVKLKMPEFKTFVQSALKEAIPEQMEFKVNGREVKFKLDGKDFAEIEKAFKDDGVFEKFYSNTDRQGLKQTIAAEAKRQISEKYINKIVEIAEASGHAAGLLAGKVGARAPFVEPGKQTIVTATSNKLTEAEKANNRDGLRRR